jgi:hypothetical protein
MTNASAGTYCSLDPTVGVGLALAKYGNSSSTILGGGVQIP